MQQQQMPYESTIGQSLYSQNAEKTFIDKTLARQEVEEIKDLMKKQDLTREDLLQLLYLVAGNESKLVNLNEWDRYVLLLFYAWIREFVSIAEGFYDYENYLAERGADFSKDTLKNFVAAKNTMIHNVKFLVDVYLNIMRTTLSLEGAAFHGILTNRFEYAYTGMQGTEQPEKKKGIMSVILKR